MKKSIYKKIIILLGFLSIVTISILVLFSAKRSRIPETVAKSVLTITYEATLKDYESLQNVVTNSLENDNVLLEYLHIMYKDQLSDNGYKIFIANRVPAIGAIISKEKNSNCKVSSIELTPGDSVQGSKRYIYTLQLQLENDISKSYTYNGSITLIQENDKWKVDRLSTN